MTPLGPLRPGARVVFADGRIGTVTSDEGQVHAGDGTPDHKAVTVRFDQHDTDTLVNVSGLTRLSPERDPGGPAHVTGAARASLPRRAVDIGRDVEARLFSLGLVPQRHDASSVADQRWLDVILAIGNRVELPARNRLEAIQAIISKALPDA